mmetsp:Transcript_66447/g.167486  ORF Transcript_66447/g.167486 Transcript_66447/m.167486 type:complete len:80 (+) Transcript_66447:1476-1715(+)
MVVPKRTAAPFRHSMTSCAVVLSNPLVGSSANKSLGWATNSMAIETRFLWPPETPRLSGVPTRDFSIPLSLRSLMTCCI